MQKISFTEHAYERYRERALGDPLRLERSIREIRSIIQSSLERHSCYSLLEKLAAPKVQTFPKTVCPLDCLNSFIVTRHP